MFPLAMYRGKFGSAAELEEAWRNNHSGFEQIAVKTEAEMMAKIDLGYVVDPKDMIEKPASKKRILPEGKAPAEPPSVLAGVEIPKLTDL
jgi:hypothetical protein